MKKKIGIGTLTGFRELCKSELITVGAKGNCKGSITVNRPNYVIYNKPSISKAYEIGIEFVSIKAEPQGPFIPEQPKNGFIPSNAVTVKIK